MSSAPSRLELELLAMERRYRRVFWHRLFTRVVRLVIAGACGVLTLWLIGWAFRWVAAWWTT